MSKDDGVKLSREERLAAKLRENLRRRKAQSRDLTRDADESPASDLSKPRGGD
ncbi:MAG: hypothetical protein WA985_08005 [Erythrobacter sp.]|uniref:hypothetical protein n=1 Tax=Erythrobacter sp. TaxID=1042 RepID=UPI003C744519